MTSYDDMDDREMSGCLRPLFELLGGVACLLALVVACTAKPYVVDLRTTDATGKVTGGLVGTVTPPKSPGGIAGAVASLLTEIVKLAAPGAVP